MPARPSPAQLTGKRPSPPAFPTTPSEHDAEVHVHEGSESAGHGFSAGQIRAKRRVRVARPCAELHGDRPHVPLMAGRCRAREQVATRSPRPSSSAGSSCRRGFVA